MAATRGAGRVAALALLTTLAVVVGNYTATAGDARATEVADGALVMFVARVEDHAAVEGARVTLSGTSRAGAAVSLTVLTDPAGRASFQGVPAGLAYRVELVSAGRPSRIVAGLAVRRALATTLLPVFVGARVALEGRLVDESGVPVPGAEVRALDDVLLMHDGPGIYDAAESAEANEMGDRQPLGTAVTDAKGRYRIEGLPAGPVEVRATAEGRRETVATVFLGPDGPVGGPPTRVLWPGTDVNGTVVDGDGGPVAGAEAFVSSARGDSSERRRAVADAAGRFHATVADTGPVLVTARRPGALSRVSRRFEAPPSVVRVPLESSTTLTLTVMDQGDGRPLPGTSVEIGVRGSMSPLEGDLWTTTISGTTNAAGRLSLPVPAGFVSACLVSASGQLGAGIDNVWWIPNGDFDAIRAVFGRRLRAGRPLAVTLRLFSHPGASGPGIVGQVVDPAGQPVVGARVVGVAVGALSPRAVSTDAEGRFRLEGTAQEIVVRADGFVQRAEGREIPTNGSGGDPPGLTLRLERPRTVRGRILDADGRGVAGACVSILPKWSNDRSISTRHRGVYDALRDPWGTTAADGTYVLHDVVPLISVPVDERDNEVKGAAPAPGPARVVVRARGFADAVSSPFQYASGSTTEAPIVRLSRGARWIGRVLDPAGRPVAGARLQVDADATATSLVALPAAGAWRTASDGSFLVSALPPGRVKVVAWAEGFAPTQKSMHVVGEGDLPSLDIVLRPAQRVSGRVVDAAGRPIPGATVVLDWLARKSGVSGASPIPDSDWDEMYTQKQQARSDDDGRFALASAPPGVVELHVEAEGWQDPSTHRSPSLVVIRVGSAPPVIMLERDPEWESQKKLESEARLKSARDELLASPDPEVRAAFEEEIERIEEELRARAARLPAGSR